MPPPAGKKRKASASAAAKAGKAKGKTVKRGADGHTMALEKRQKLTMPVADNDNDEDEDYDDEDSHDDDNDEEDTTSSDTSDYDDESNDDAEDSPAVQWFNLEGCEPAPEDAPGVARLLRRCLLPPGSTSAAAADQLARLLVAPPHARTASVVKQGRSIDDERGNDEHGNDERRKNDEHGNDEYNDEDDETVYAVTGVVPLDALNSSASLRRLRDSLLGVVGGGNKAGGTPSWWLLAKARAPQLPPELALAQLEALAGELTVAGAASVGRLIVVSPAWQTDAGSDDGLVAMFEEDDVLLLQDESRTAPAWLGELPSGGGAGGSGGGDDDDDEASSVPRRYRVGVLEAARLPDAVKRLRGVVGDRLRPAR